MALADPQVVTIAGTAHSMPRKIDGTFSTADGYVNLQARGNTTQRGTVQTRNVRVEQKKVANNPVNNTPGLVAATVNVTITAPTSGEFTIQQQIDILTGVVSWLSASSYANAVKVVGGEG